MNSSGVRRIAAVLSCLFAGAVLTAQTAQVPNPSKPKTTAPSPAIQANFGHLPLSFEQNTGQTAPNVQWLARGPESTLFLSGNDATVEIHRMEKVKRDGVDLLQTRGASVRMSLLHSQPAQSSVGEQMQPGKANYFTGSDRSRWRKNIALYGQVRLDEVYPGVSLLYHGERGQLEYDFNVAPHADPTRISLGFTGAAPSLASNGDLLLPIKDGPTVRFDKPVVYQIVDGTRTQIDSGYLIASDGQVRFQLGRYDRTRELVIDPKLVFLGTLGAGNYPYAANLGQIAVDSTGATYFIGTTNDPTYPTTSGAYQQVCGPATGNDASSGGVYCGTYGSTSAYVTKLSADGTTLEYSTYLSGHSGYEQGTAIAVDSSGVAYLVGATASNDFPITSDAFQSLCQPGQSPGFHAAQVPTAQCDNFGDGGGTEYTVNGPVLFFAKLSADGSSLVYSSFLGGSDGASPIGTALDSDGNWYILAQTSALLASNVYPVASGSNKVQYPGVSASGYQTVSTAIYNDQTTDPEDITTVAALSKFSNDGKSLLYGTFFGDEVNGYPFYPTDLAVGVNGVAFLGGWSSASAIVTSAGAVKGSCTAVASPAYTCTTVDGYAVVFDTAKSGSASLVYSTRIGGTAAAQGSNIPNQEALGIAADSSNDAYVTGYTYDQTFPVPQSGYMNSCNVVNPGNVNNCDTAFVLELNPTGTKILAGSFLSGPPAYYESSIGYKVKLDSNDLVYLYGTSQDGYDTFPLVNPVQGYQNNNELYIATMSSDLTKLLFSTRLGNPSLSGGNAYPVNGLALDPSSNIYFAGTTEDASFAATPGTYTTSANSGTENHTFFGKISAVLPIGVTTLTISPTTADTGQSVTFTASVATIANTAAPTGTVVLSYTTSSNSTPTNLKTLDLDSSGSATFSSSSLAAGTYTFTAAYSGDSNYDAGTSSAVTLTISSAAATTLSLSSSDLSVAPGANVTFTAKASGASGTPTGKVTFLSGTTTLGTGTLNGSGDASYTTSFSKAGSYSITASYGGDSTYSAVVSSAITEVVTASTASVALASSAAKASAGYDVTFTATVTGTGSTAPTGTVTFLNGTTTLGTGTISNGKATYSTSTLAVGSQSITASYGGDGNYAAAVSTALTETIVAVSFSINYTPSPVTIKAGSAGTTTMSVTPGAAYSDTVTLGCNGAADSITCTFAPASLNWTTSNSTGAQTAVITIQTTAPHPSAKTASLWTGTWLGSLIGCISLLLLTRKRRLALTTRSLLLLAVLLGSVGALTGLTGCGGGGSGGQKLTGGTPTGTLSLSITFNGKDNGTPLSITVQ